MSFFKDLNIFLLEINSRNVVLYGCDFTLFYFIISLFFLSEKLGEFLLFLY